MTSFSLKLNKNQVPELWTVKMLPRLHIQKELARLTNSKSSERWLKGTVQNLPSLLEFTGCTPVRKRSSGVSREGQELQLAA